MSTDIPSDAPKPRLCHVRKWSDFNGYGFNLHAEKGKVGQYIGKVDPGSPAEVAGLKENDKIVEVNGTNISNENHQQVVQRIKAVPNQTKVLVMDAETEEYYKNQRIVVRGDMSSVDSRDSGSRRGEVTTADENPAPEATTAAPASSQGESTPRPLSPFAHCMSCSVLSMSCVIHMLTCPPGDRWQIHNRYLPKLQSFRIGSEQWKSWIILSYCFQV